MVAKFKYRGRDRTVEDVKRAATMSTGNYDSMIVDGFTMFKPKEGENVIRVLPPTWPDDEVDIWGKDWAIIISVHNNVGPDGGSFLCLDAMRNEPCPICEARRNAVDDEERYQLSPNKRALAWLADRNDMTAGPQPWSMPIKKIFKVINARSIDRRGGGLMLIDDPEEGYDVFFNVEGAGKKTADYTGVEVDRDPRPLHDDEKKQAQWLQYITDNPLPSLLNWPDPDYIEKVLFGKKSRRAEAAEGEVEEEEAPFETSGRRRPAARDEQEAEAPPARRTARRPAVEDLPPEDEVVEETEEVEGEAPPARRTARRAEPEVQEDEAPPPRRAARRPVADEVEPEPPPPRRTARQPREDEQEAPAPRRPVRRPAAEDVPPEDEPPPSRVARKGLERLRPGARR